MTRHQYTTLWWEGSATTLNGATPIHTDPPVGPDIDEAFTRLGADGWELVTVTAAPLTTGWISPAGHTAVTGFTDRVHYLAVFRKAEP